MTNRETFHVDRHLDGRVMVRCPPTMLVPPDVAIAMGRALLQICGVEVIVAEPGQTVIRPPRGNGNGILK